MVTGDVDEDGHRAVGLVARHLEELDPVLDHAAVLGLEVVDVQEQPDATAELVADGSGLTLAVGLREQQPGLRAGRAHHHPSLRPAVVRHRRRVLHEIEAEGVDEEADGLVVVLDEHGHLRDAHRRNLDGRRGNRIRTDVVCSNVMMQQRSGRPPAAMGFEDLYRRQIGSLRTLAAGLTGSREVGAELAQEAMLRAYRDWDRVAALDRPGAWVRRVVINLATDVHRRRMRELRAVERLPVGEAQRPADPVDGDFWRALRALPTGQRNAAVLFYVDDLGVDQIAEILLVGSGTVKKALFDARKNLARTLGADDVEVAS